MNLGAIVDESEILTLSRCVLAFHEDRLTSNTVPVMSLGDSPTPDSGTMLGMNLLGVAIAAAQYETVYSTL